jgi:hypothetical protein
MKATRSEVRSYGRVLELSCRDTPDLDRDRRWWVATAFQEVGLLSEARQLFEELICDKAHVGERGRVMQNYSNTLHLLREPQLALEAGIESLEFKLSLGMNSAHDPESLQAAAYGLSLYLKDLGEHRQSKELAELAYAVAVKFLGPHHWRSKAVASSLKGMR